MNWLLETLTEPSMIQAVAVISIVAAVGVYLGRLKIFGISLGITFVFFAGIMAGHLGITVNKDMLNFAQNFGLIVFVYTLGLQVGPGFFSSLKKGGVEMNTMGLGVIALGLILTLVFHWITGISVPVRVAIRCRNEYPGPRCRPASALTNGSGKYEERNGYGSGLCRSLSIRCRRRNSRYYHLEVLIRKKDTEHA